MKNAATFSPSGERLKLSAYVFKYSREFWIQAVGGVIYNTVIVMGPVFLGRSIDAADQVMSRLTPDVDAVNTLFSAGLVSAAD